MICQLIKSRTRSIISIDNGCLNICCIHIFNLESRNAGPTKREAWGIFPTNRVLAPVLTIVDNSPKLIL